MKFSLAIFAFLGVSLSGLAAYMALEPQSTVARHAAVATLSTGPVSSDVMLGWDGHFRADATLNGRVVKMLVDTGASLVLLTDHDARAAGIAVDSLDFDLPILTANGRGHVASITLPVLSVGDVVVRRVRAAVAAPGQLHASLLGMSFLGEIDEAVIRRDRLILRN